MQENHRNGQDDSDIVESEPFTLMRAALNRHISSSADYNWLKQGSESIGKTSLSQF